MTPGDKIEIDFKQVMAQADKIDKLAEEWGSLSGRKFGSSLQNLAAGWKGDNASLYLAKGSSLQKEMDNTARELHDVAADIRRKAQRLYTAEMAALSIATGRIY